MVEKIAPALAWIGYGYSLLRQSLDAGKEGPEVEEIRVRKALEADRKKVSPVYRPEKENIEHYKGKHQREIIGDLRPEKENIEHYKGKHFDVRV